ncbi:MAG: signal recognition particle-docking protein FtsY [Oceanospirillaceae bacterium]|nr:signal recognition particle-docking protein FtsY [Oceanospirillaceae bacterium]
MFNFFKRKKGADDNKEAEAKAAAESTEQTNDSSDDAAVSEAAESLAAEQVTEVAVGDDVEADAEEESQQAEEPAAVEAEMAEPEAADALVTEAEKAEPEVTEPEATEPAVSAVVESVADVPFGLDTTAARPGEEKASAKKPGFFSRIRQGLSKTRSGLTDGLANLLLGKKEIDDDLLEDLETQLIMADVGVETTQAIMQRLTDRVSRKELGDSDALYHALIAELQETLATVQAPLTIDSSKTPYVILMVGINGVGKTTTIGKLAKQFQNDGKSVMLAAGDTSRAAAVEQLQVWGERNNVPVIAQHTGADSASVIFDAVQAAKARKADILIADTAGRLHNKDNLMQELEKVVRVMRKLDDTAPHEVMLVLDAGTGQNAVNQAKQFQQAVGVTGLTLTKLDGTAKGGIIFSLAQQFGLPVRYIGVGEGIDDLRTFNAEEFTKALFQRDADEQ